MCGFNFDVDYHSLAQHFGCGRPRRPWSGHLGPLLHRQLAKSIPKVQRGSRLDLALPRKCVRTILAVNERELPRFAGAGTVIDVDILYANRFSLLC